MAGADNTNEVQESSAVWEAWTYEPKLSGGSGGWSSTFDNSGTGEISHGHVFVVSGSVVTELLVSLL
jgi:hypothetical protein